jgi:peptidoglycan/xylan/chitin deacetylase (PgdA/CDA1 family)
MPGIIRPIREKLYKAKELRVLMYHSVSSNGHVDSLTVGADTLEEQFQYLCDEGYTSILLSDLVAFSREGKPLPKNPVLITFDDGYKDNYELAYSLAQQYSMKINLFLVPAFIWKGNYRDRPCLQPEDIAKMDPALVEIGLHSYDHQSYADLLPWGIGIDIERSKAAMEEWGIPYQPCLAYPYGAFPRRKGYDQDKLFEIMEEKGIQLAFRIGNRVNKLPLRKRFLVQRLDIRGDETMRAFRLHLRYGRKKTGFFFAFGIGVAAFLLVSLLFRCFHHSLI